MVCDELPWIHFEVKAVERLNIKEAMEQARRDAGKAESAPGGRPPSERRETGNEKIPIVAHRRRFCAWLVTMEVETFFRFLRGELTEGNEGNEGPGGRPPLKISDFEGPLGLEKDNKQ